MRVPLVTRQAAMGVAVFGEGEGGEGGGAGYAGVRVAAPGSGGCCGKLPVPWSGGGLLLCLAFLVWANAYVMPRHTKKRPKKSSPPAEVPPAPEVPVAPPEVAEVPPEVPPEHPSMVCPVGRQLG